MSKSVRRPSPALIVAIVALVAALAGSAIALPGKNTVQSNDIKKGAVKSKHLKNNGVKGKDVDEASLGTVPSAATAATAANLLGHTRLALIVGEGEHTLLALGPFTLKGTCEIDEGGNDTATFNIETATDDSALESDGTDDDDFDVADNPLDISDSSAPTGDPDVDQNDDQLVAIAANGATFTSGDYFSAVNVGGEPGCYFGGTFEQVK